MSLQDTKSFEDVSYHSKLSKTESSHSRFEDGVTESSPASVVFDLDVVPTSKETVHHDGNQHDNNGSTNHITLQHALPQEENTVLEENHETDIQHSDDHPSHETEVQHSDVHLSSGTEVRHSDGFQNHNDINIETINHNNLSEIENSHVPDHKITQDTSTHVDISVPQVEEQDSYQEGHEVVADESSNNLIQSQNDNIEVEVCEEKPFEEDLTRLAAEDQLEIDPLDSNINENVVATEAAAPPSELVTNDDDIEVPTSLPMDPSIAETENVLSENETNHEIPQEETYETSSPPEAEMPVDVKPLEEEKDKEIIAIKPSDEEPQIASITSTVVEQQDLPSKDTVLSDSSDKQSSHSKNASQVSDADVTVRASTDNPLDALEEVRQLKPVSLMRERFNRGASFYVSPTPGTPTSTSTPTPAPPKEKVEVVPAAEVPPPSVDTSSSVAATPVIFLDPAEVEISYAKLREAECPEGIDKLRKEEYLSDDEFLEVFKMTKEQYLKLPKWRRINKKKEVGLF